MNLHRVSAFSHNGLGGNPAGVAVLDTMPEPDQMLKTAKEVGYSETAFIHPYKDGWRVRYFSPEVEVPFCGHATIATGFILGEIHGPGSYPLYLNNGKIDVSVSKTHGAPSKESTFVSLNSPETFSEPAGCEYTDRLLTAFEFFKDDLDPRFPLRFASAGAKHLIIVLAKLKTLTNMKYDFDEVKALMAEQNLITINLLWLESQNKFHSRNPFPSGGVYEDPATGAAAAALAGYLRDIQWSGGSMFEILQGESMGSPSRLLVEYDKTQGSSVKVAGQAMYL
jgi:PhzF family phenazine biosynthesis protein